MELLIGLTTVLGAGLIYAGAKLHYAKKNTKDLEEAIYRESLYAKVHPIKRVLLRYHRLMEPHEFRDVSIQQAKFGGIQGAIEYSRKLKNILKEEGGEVLTKTTILGLVHHHETFFEALSERNKVVKRQLQEVPRPSSRPPSPSDLDRKMEYLRRSVDEYDNCLYKYNVEKCLAEMREVAEILRFHAPEVLVKASVWEAIVRNEHFLIELVNLLPENCQKGIRTDATMLVSKEK